MGLPVDWVTGVPYEPTPSRELAALGNGVLPLQAVVALRRLILSARLSTSSKCQVRELDQVTTSHYVFHQTAGL